MGWTRLTSATSLRASTVPCAAHVLSPLTWLLRVLPSSRRVDPSSERRRPRRKSTRLASSDPIELHPTHTMHRFSTHPQDEINSVLHGTLQTCRHVDATKREPLKNWLSLGHGVRCCPQNPPQLAVSPPSSARKVKHAMSIIVTIVRSGPTTWSCSCA